MKIILLLLSVLTGKYLFAQSECNVLASATTPIPGCTYNSTASCETWSNSCGNGWIRSHGSPQLKSYLWDSYKNIYHYYYYMWNYNSSQGEGMFKAFNFSSGSTYTVDISFFTSHAQGKILVYAASGLSQGPSGCGSAIPTSSVQKQLIYEYTGFTNGWAYSSITFTANANYNQIWIYPVNNSSAQLDIGVESLSICGSLCATSIVYNNGNIPIGITKKGTIYAGSSAGTGGSGVVSAQQNQVTQLIGIKEVILLPSFQAIPGTGELRISNDTCLDISTRKVNVFKKLPTPTAFRIEPTHELYLTSTDMSPAISKTIDKKVDSLFKIYPSISNGTVYIKSPITLRENIEISIYDVTGKEVYKSIRSHNQTNHIVNCHQLTNGIYIIKIKNRDINISSKIVISK